jgi:hypothetical protein
MIVHNIGPTDIVICESTAQCLVYNPTETCIDLIVNYITNNNFTCGAIYHENINKAVLLQQQVGGQVITDSETAKAYESTLC